MYQSKPFTKWSWWKMEYVRSLDSGPPETDLLQHVQNKNRIQTKKIIVKKIQTFQTPEQILKTWFVFNLNLNLPE